MPTTLSTLESTSLSSRNISLVDYFEPNRKKSAVPNILFRNHFCGWYWWRDMPDVENVIFKPEYVLTTDVEPSVSIFKNFLNRQNLLFDNVDCYFPKNRVTVSLASFTRANLDGGTPRAPNAKNHLPERQAYASIRGEGRAWNRLGWTIFTDNVIIRGSPEMRSCIFYRSTRTPFYG